MAEDDEILCMQRHLLLTFIMTCMFSAITLKATCTHTVYMHAPPWKKVVLLYNK